MPATANVPMIGIGGVAVYTPHLVRESTARHADAIVIGTRPAGLHARVIGSDAEGVVRIRGAGDAVKAAG
jgi:hypothetical protein